MALFGFIMGLFLCIYLTYAAIAIVITAVGFGAKVEILPVTILVVCLISFWYILLSNAPFILTVTP